MIPAIVGGNAVEEEKTGPMPFYDDKTTEDAIPELVRLQRHIDHMYSERNMLVSLVMKLCQQLGFEAGLQYDPSSGFGYEVQAYFNLPSGQVRFSIHETELAAFAGLPIYKRKHDGHTPQERWERIVNPQLEPWFMRPWSTKAEMCDTFSTQVGPTILTNKKDSR